MESEHVNSNGENVVASNINHVDFSFFENYEYQVWKQISYVMFFATCPISQTWQ
jgi:hypothetical protein